MDIVIARPARATSILLLLHGVHATPESLRPLAMHVAARHPALAIRCLAAPHAGEQGGRQWFSIDGIDEENRRMRVAAAVPGLLARIADIGNESGIRIEDTTLFGFSQGGILLLEAAKNPALKGSDLIAASARFAQTPLAALYPARIALIHGEADPLFSASLALDAHARLLALGNASTLRLIPGLGHAIDGRVVDALLAALRK